MHDAEKSYVLKTSRLGFRNWTRKDIPFMSSMNSDERVMEFFPNTLTKEESAAFLGRMQNHFSNHGFCYFAVDLLETGECIGFIGLLHQSYESPFTPCVDVGWRLAVDYWGKGYATEGAKACLEYAFYELGIEKIYSVASCVNVRSEHVMRKIGMHKIMEFDHPKIIQADHLKRCVVYKISRADL